MKPHSLWLVIAFTTAVLAEVTQAQAPRQVETVVRSAADPAADIVVNASFSYLGRVNAVVMKGRATMEQHWFAKADSGRISRIVVVHFEKWNDGVAGTFDYPTFRERTLGSHKYLHQSFPFDSGCELVNPDARSLMQRARLAMARECIGTRLVRAASADRRSEIILFFVEPVDVLPSLEGLGDGGLPVGYDRPGSPETPWSRTDRRLTEEMLRAVHIRDRP